MKLDSAAVDCTPGEAGAIAKRAEDQGYDGFWLAETKHDPFLALAGAAAATERIELGTAIAVAFARNPMTVATTANDLRLLSEGRFNLGLGSQVEAHITKRFSMPWSKPAARMREFVLAIRAIWHAWETGERLAFRGEFYKHTLMTPFFDPGPNPHGTAPIYLAGVGGLMTEVAGEVADGFLCHNFTTERYLREVTLPALERGRAKAGKTLEGFEISGPVFAATNDQEIADVKRQIAFYGSTPAYRPVLDLHGWGALHDELHRMSRRQQWAQMSKLITDEVLAEFCVLGTPETVTAALLDRYGDVVTRVSPSSSVLQRPEK
ncbi:TIGR03617 family F420-dependent LLM class oxidoreductase [Lentzea flaviverrucosa]|uniref:Probable F420-dependent oxidoreductase, MSMEG_2256 family n=1 Tax=Lentzea flaviverrucosa TaxID=200379 RepID=A0A1H9X362_9PSEU|nr:TIGR03617 family F420-dependent LLM class oxidoreductase [Lentzea flaviverrucosa]RDI20895.1 putative F420-dependent oxidoreductase [Lentzea flaviverrucosa]SES40648.1 probable F420-dependent oxidoreductase, MSMEG_2256 family [Lentzea flaviverrucosa]